MTKKVRAIPTMAYDLYLEGLKAIMKKNNFDLEAARDLALQQARQTHGNEHLPLIEAAYSKLKEGK